MAGYCNSFDRLFSFLWQRLGNILSRCFQSHLMSSNPFTAGLTSIHFFRKRSWVHEDSIALFPKWLRSYNECMNTFTRVGILVSAMFIRNLKEGRLSSRSWNGPGWGGTLKVSPYKRSIQSFSRGRRSHTGRTDYTEGMGFSMSQLWGHSQSGVCNDFVFIASLKCLLCT